MNTAREQLIRAAWKCYSRYVSFDVRCIWRLPLNPLVAPSKSEENPSYISLNETSADFEIVRDFSEDMTAKRTRIYCEGIVLEEQKESARYRHEALI